MIARASTRWSLLRAGVFSVLLVAAPASAQQPRDQPSPPVAPPAATPMPITQPQPTTVPGRPDIPNAEVATQLRGIPAPPDRLPIRHFKLPKGLNIEVYVSGVPNARSLRIGDKGTVFVSNRQLDKVYAIVDKNGKREALVIASGLDRPNGLAFLNGTLYIAEVPRFPSLSRSRTTSITRRSLSSSTVAFSIISRTAGNSWA
jgi:glucose/arabinose dehydrogenase